MSDIDKRIQELLDAEGMKISYEITFPIYKILPDEVQLAMKVLAKHGMKVSITIVPKKKQDQ